MISDKAEIHPGAKIADDVEIGPWTVVGDNVEIGAGTKISAHSVILGPTTIGKNNQIFPFTSLGDAPQDKEYQGEDTELIIGDNNVIREYCTINRGTTKGGGLTEIGDDNFLMAYAHIAHDCHVGNHTIFANYAALAGHVTIEDYVNISAYAAVHQFVTVGESSFVTKATYITKDVLPYVIVAGYSPAACGVNTVGLKRRGYSPDVVDTIRRCYKIIFRKGLLKQQAIDELAPYAAEYPEIKKLCLAMERAERGIVR